MPNSQKPEPSADYTRLKRSVNWALRNDLPASELVPMLRKLIRQSGAEETGFVARIALAELLLESQASPGAVGWECARLGKEARGLSCSPQQRCRAWAVSALAYTVLGHHRSARYAYQQALREDPTDAVCAHNLGHLLHVCFDLPELGRRWLRIAFSKLPSDPEVAASYAYALVACGSETQAIDVLAAALGDRKRAAGHVEEWARAARRSNFRE